MVDLTWPADMPPYRVAFYLQPHVGGSESPFSRVRKTYSLSAPRWVARLTFRGGYNGAVRMGDATGFGARLDAMIADLRGGEVLVQFHDWRRPRPSHPIVASGTLVLAAAAKGATAVSIAGFAPNSVALSVGDYVGGDGRPHLVSLAATLAAGGSVRGAGSIIANSAGVAVIGIQPPLSAPIAGGTPAEWPVTGRFQLVGEDGGQNETEVGQAVEHVLDFVEDLG